MMAPHTARSAETLAASRPDEQRVRFDELYLLLALVILCFLISLTPIIAIDFWWHLRVGQLIADTGRIPKANLFAWTLPLDTPYIYGAWLSEWLLNTLYRQGDVPLVIFTRNALAFA